MKRIIKTVIAMVILILLVLILSNRETVIRGILLENFDLDDSAIDYRVDINELSKYKRNYFYYNVLNDQQKKIYCLILKGIGEHKKSITLNVGKNIDYEGVTNDVSRAMESVLADYPEIFYVNLEYEISANNVIGVHIISLNLSYNLTEEQARAQSVEIKEKIDKIIAENITNDMSDYEKELALHDYLAKNIVYYSYTNMSDIPASKHGIYDALINNSAVCDGISKSYQVILNMIEMDNIFVTGNVDNEPHAWNIVKVEDSCYHVDITSDMSLMKNYDNKLVIHAYFNNTTEQIKQSHSIDREDILPICKGNKYNYYIKENYTITYLENFSYKLKQIISKQKEDTLLEFKAENFSGVPEKLVDTLYNSNFNNYKTNGITRIQYTNVNNIYVVVK